MGELQETWWSPEAVVGYRLWSVRHDRIEGSRTVWRRPALQARCGNAEATTPLPHVAHRCACGIYATKTPEALRSHFPGMDRSRVALGRVALTGRVIEHVGGYRAERAKVTAIAVRSRKRVFAFDSEDTITALFANPAVALARAEPLPELPYERNAETLTAALAGIEKGHHNGYR